MSNLPLKHNASDNIKPSARSLYLEEIVRNAPLPEVDTK